jgi:Ca2+-binding EF-hand superfamily protein
MTAVLSSPSAAFGPAAELWLDRLPCLVRWVPDPIAAADSASPERRQRELLGAILRRESSAFGPTASATIAADSAASMTIVALAATSVASAAPHARTKGSYGRHHRTTVDDLQAMLAEPDAREKVIRSVCAATAAVYTVGMVFTFHLPTALAGRAPKFMDPAVDDSAVIVPLAAVRRVVVHRAFSLIAGMAMTGVDDDEESVDLSKSFDFADASFMSASASLPVESPTVLPEERFTVVLVIVDGSLKLQFRNSANMLQFLTSLRTIASLHTEGAFRWYGSTSPFAAASRLKQALSLYDAASKAAENAARDQQHNGRPPVRTAHSPSSSEVLMTDSSASAVIPAHTPPPSAHGQSGEHVNEGSRSQSSPGEDDGDGDEARQRKYARAAERLAAERLRARIEETLFNRLAIAQRSRSVHGLPCHLNIRQHYATRNVLGQGSDDEADTSDPSSASTTATKPDAGGGAGGEGASRLRRAASLVAAASHFGSFNNRAAELKKRRGTGMRLDREYLKDVLSTSCPDDLRAKVNNVNGADSDFDDDDRLNDETLHFADDLLHIAFVADDPSPSAPEAVVPLSLLHTYQVDQRAAFTALAVKYGNRLARLWCCIEASAHPSHEIVGPDVLATMGKGAGTTGNDASPAATELLNPLALMTRGRQGASRLQTGSPSVSASPMRRTQPAAAAAFDGRAFFRELNVEYVVAEVGGDAAVLTNRRLILSTKHAIEFSSTLVAGPNTTRDPASLRHLFADRDYVPDYVYFPACDIAMVHRLSSDAVLIIAAASEREREPASCTGVPAALRRAKAQRRRRANDIPTAAIWDAAEFVRDVTTGSQAAAANAPGGAAGDSSGDDDVEFVTSKAVIVGLVPAEQDAVLSWWLAGVAHDTGVDALIARGVGPRGRAASKVEKPPPSSRARGGGDPTDDRATPAGVGADNHHDWDSHGSGGNDGVGLGVDEFAAGRDASKTMSVVRRMYYRFNRIDESRDGNIDDDELDAALGCLCTCAAYSRNLFHTLDLDGSGLISFREFTVGISEMIFASVVSKFRTAIQLFDDDRDGRVTAMQLASALTVLVSYGDVLGTEEEIKQAARQVAIRIGDLASAITTAMPTPRAGDATPHAIALPVITPLLIMPAVSVEAETGSSAGASGAFLHAITNASRPAFPRTPGRMRSGSSTSNTTPTLMQLMSTSGLSATAKRGNRRLIGISEFLRAAQENAAVCELLQPLGVELGVESRAASGLVDRRLAPESACITYGLLDWYAASSLMQCLQLVVNTSSAAAKRGARDVSHRMGDGTTTPQRSRNASALTPMASGTFVPPGPDDRSQSTNVEITITNGPALPVRETSEYTQLQRIMVNVPPAVISAISHPSDTQRAELLAFERDHFWFTTAAAIGSPIDGPPNPFASVTNDLATNGSHPTRRGPGGSASPNPPMIAVEDTEMVDALTGGSKTTGRPSSDDEHDSHSEGDSPTSKPTTGIAVDSSHLHVYAPVMFHKLRSRLGISTFEILDTFALRNIVASMVLGTDDVLQPLHACFATPADTEQPFNPVDPQASTSAASQDRRAAFSFRSHDGNVLLRAMAPEDMHGLLLNLESYEEHIRTNPDTLLPRYLGLYSLVGPKQKPSSSPGGSDGIAPPIACFALLVSPLHPVRPLASLIAISGRYRPKAGATFCERATQAAAKLDKAEFSEEREKARVAAAAAASAAAAEQRIGCCGGDELHLTNHERGLHHIDSDGDADLFRHAVFGVQHTAAYANASATPVAMLDERWLTAPVTLHEDWAAVLEEQLEKDTEWLALRGIHNYRLACGFTEPLAGKWSDQTSATTVSACEAIAIQRRHEARMRAKKAAADTAAAAAAAAAAEASPSSGTETTGTINPASIALPIPATPSTSRSPGLNASSSRHHFRAAARQLHNAEHARQHQQQNGDPSAAAGPHHGPTATAAHLQHPLDTFYDFGDFSSDLAFAGALIGSFARLAAWGLNKDQRSGGTDPSEAPAQGADACNKQTHNKPLPRSLAPGLGHPEPWQLRRAAGGRFTATANGIPVQSETAHLVASRSAKKQRENDRQVAASAAAASTKDGSGKEGAKAAQSSSSAGQALHPFLIDIQFGKGSETGDA